MMICRKVKANLPDLLLAPKSVPAEVRAHVESCAECGKELRELEATMALLDTWTAPEVSPYFDTRMAGLMREEQQAAPAGWLERIRARMLFGNHMHMRPLAAAALALIVAVGGGTYAGFGGFSKPAQVQTTASPVIKDLQSLDENAQVFQQLNSMDQQDAGDKGGGAGNSL
jgi:anti-sigma factor RsiW